jgi:integrase-like protein
MKTWRSAWRTLTKAAGLRGLRFHDLRHLAITELLESGLPDQAVMEIAGYVSGDPVTGNFPRLDFNAVPERKLERFRALMAQTTSQKTLGRDFFTGKVLNCLVGARGFEPPTPWSRTKPHTVYQ